MKISFHHALYTLALLIVIAALVLSGNRGFSYLPSLTAPGPQPDRWDFTAFPVMWNLNPATGSNISGSNSVASVMQAAFNTWTSAPNAVIPVTRGADSTISLEASTTSDINLVCFICSDGDFALDTTTLAIAITTTANAAGESDGHGGTTRFVGQLIKADILFNSSVTFTTGGTSGHDLQTVATHEVGHLLGMAHSAIVRAVMFPYASTLTTLSYDDVAGISTLYPKTTPDIATGSLSGRITLNGAGVFGAHVFAESVTDNAAFPPNIRKTPIGTLTFPDGNYTIQGVPGDSYVVVVAPLSGVVTNLNVSGYAPAYGQPTVQMNFTARWH